MSEIQEYSMLLIAVCIFMLAGINVFLVWRLITGQRSDSVKLTGIAGQCEQIMVSQVAVKDMVSSPPAPLDTSTLEKLDAALSHNYDNLNESALGFSNLVQELHNVSPENLAAWKSLNEPRIEELLRKRDDLQEQVGSLRDMLAHANATILNLRAQTWHKPGGKSENKLTEELQHARRNSTRLSAELNEARLSIQGLIATLGMRDKQLADATKAQQQLRTESEIQIAQLNEKIDALQASYDRTLVEKGFIEEAFLEAQSGAKRE